MGPSFINITKLKCRSCNINYIQKVENYFYLNSPNNFLSLTSAILFCENIQNESENAFVYVTPDTK